MNFEPGRNVGGGRWYPTLVTLANGLALAMSGHPSSNDSRHNNNSPETFSSSPPPSGSWTLLGSAAAAHEMNYYPRLHVLPDGDVFCSTPLENGRNARLNPSTSTWTDVSSGPSDPIYNGLGSTSVLLPLLPVDNYRARILLCGGRQPLVIDPASSPTWRPTSPRTLAGTPERYHLNAVLLPTGEVFVSGGIAVGNSDANAVLEAELYQPGTDSWVTLPPAAVRRNYHSVALLMPDGRVWTAGSNKGAQQSFPQPGVDNRELRIEIFEPWYYSANRPQITSAPSAAIYGQTFEVQTPQANSINRVAVIRAGSVTHAFNPDQRYVGLQFSRTASDRLAVTAPPNGRIAPPGYYLLFILNQEGVPSVGQFLRFVAKPKEKDVKEKPEKEKDKDLKDRKEALKDKEIVKDRKEALKDKEQFKEKDKDREAIGQPAEEPEAGSGTDLSQMIDLLAVRIEAIEQRLASGQAFIQYEERPQLGEEMPASEEALAQEEPPEEPGEQEQS